ncbi:MAG TPA: hypothetical protein VF132_00010 [Rudaea sp.]
MSVLHRFANLFRRDACVIERLGRASIAWNPHHTIYLREYYRYCVDLFRQALANEDVPVNVIFGRYDVDFANNRRTRRVDIQHEHTLVKPGGRDSDGAPEGRIPLADGCAHYLVRIAHRDYLETLDAVIDYSLPNLINLRASGLFPDLLRKCVHVSALLYDADLATKSRDVPMMTLIHDTNQPRRRRFFDAARAARLPLRNVRGTFDAAQLRRQYDRTRILVNLHQTDHHDTFEELRVLPALLRGVVVVSEDVPLREQIPYHQAIVWCRYDDLVATAQAVHADYDRYRARLFDETGIAAVFETMRRNDRISIAQIVRQWCD